jgi:hypothetical protein
MKNLPKDCTILVWIVGDVGNLHSQAVIVVSPAVFEHGLAEKITVCTHTNRDPNKQEE